MKIFLKSDGHFWITKLFKSNEFSSNLKSVRNISDSNVMKVRNMFYVELQTTKNKQT